MNFDCPVAKYLSTCLPVCLLQKESAGKHDAAGGQAQLLFQELRTELLDYQHRLRHQDHDLRVLANREKCSVNEITHMNEKLEYLERLREDLQEKLSTGEAALARSKKRTFEEHMRRDSARKLKAQLLEASELLTRTRLTSDFEDKIRLRTELILELKAVKRAFSALIMQPNWADQKLLEKKDQRLLPKNFDDPETVLELCDYAKTLAA